MKRKTKDVISFLSLVFVVLVIGWYVRDPSQSLDNQKYLCYDFVNCPNIRF